MNTPEPESIDAARERVRTEARAARERNDALRSLASTISAVTGSARSQDGSIRVTAATDGRVIGIEIDDRATETGGPALGRALVAVVAEAQRDAVERAAAVSAARLGEAHPLVADLAGSAQRFGGSAPTLRMG